MKEIVRRVIESFCICPTPSLPFLVVWFTLWTALASLVGIRFISEMRWQDFETYTLAALLLGGALSACVLSQPLTKTVVEQKWIFGAFLGVVGACLTLEMATISVGLAFASALDADIERVLLLIILAPILASPLLLTVCPLSGILLVALARFLDGSRSRSRIEVLLLESGKRMWQQILDEVRS